MKKILVSMLVLMAGRFALSQQPIVFTPEQLREDHEVLVRSLQELHPGLYRYLTKAGFNQAEQRVRSRLNKPMTEEAYYRLAAPLIAELKCGHTKWHRQGRPDDRYAFRQAELFPLRLYFTGNKAYVLKSYHAMDTIAKGAEILSINGRKITDIQGQLRRFITIDGNVQSTLRAELNQSFNGYYASFIGTAPVYTVVIRQGSKGKALKLRAVSLDLIRKMDGKEKEVNRNPIELTIPKTGVAVLRIDRFYTNKNERDYYSFIDSAFLAIKNAAIKSLVLDLRNNEGGVEEFGGYLYAYLSAKPFVYYRKITVATNQLPSIKQYASFPPGFEQALPHVQEKDGEFLWPVQEYLSQQSPKPNAFEGKLYIITNGLSFSVTAEFASAIKTAGRAVFIGEETGGAYEGNNSGVFASVTLPHTKLTAGIPLMGFYMNAVPTFPPGRGIQPNIAKESTVQDVLRGKDIILEKALTEAANNK